MQVRDTPLRVNERGNTVVLSVGTGGSGIYYGPSESAVKTNTAAPGAQVTITSPMYVQSQGLRDGPPADLDVLGEDTAPASSGSGGAPEVAGRAWQPSTAYKAGDIYTNAGAVYAATADHTSGASFTGANSTLLSVAGNVFASSLANGSIAVAVTSTLIVPSNNARSALTLSNGSDTGMWVTLATTGAAVGQGIYLAPGGGQWTEMYSGPASAVHVGASGTKQLGYTEF